MTTKINITFPGSIAGASRSIEVKSYEVTTAGVLLIKLPDGRLEYHSPHAWLKVSAPAPKSPGPVKFENSNETNIMEAGF